MVLNMNNETNSLQGFQGLFFDEITELELVKLQKNGLSDIVKDMHVTFKFGEIEPFPSDLMEKEFNVKIIGYASDGKNSGFKVEIPENLKSYYKNENVPHITVSLGEINGVKGNAVDTGKLDFKPFDQDIKIPCQLGYFIFGKGKFLNNNIFMNK